jgi:hypothetical protein
MYLSAHRVRRIKGERAKVGVNVFLHQHEEHDLPENLKDDNSIVDQIANQNPGKLIAESVDLVPGSNAVLSFVDVVGKEGLDKEPIRDFLHQKEHDIERHFREKQEPFTDSRQDIAVKFGISYGLRGQEVREYKALAERAIRLFESREPPRWRTEKPWIVIQREICENQQRFSLTPGTAEKLQQIHGETWISSRVSIDRHAKQNLELMHGDLIQHIAPILTGLTLEQIAIQGGLMLHDPTFKKKIKWPELREI